MPPIWSAEPWFFPVAVVLHALALWGLLRMAPQLFDTASRRRAAWATLAAAILWTVACLGPWRAAWPAAWLTLLQEGFTGDTLRWLAAGGLHTGPLLMGFWHNLVPGGVMELRDVAAVNRWAMGLHTLVLGHLVFRIAPDRVLATTLMVACIASPLYLNTATSSQPGPITGLYLMLTAIPVLGAWGLRPWARMGLLALLTLLVSMVRVEVAGFGLTALSLLLLQHLAPAWLARVSTRAEAVRARVTARPLRAALGLTAFLFLAPYVARFPPLWIRPFGEKAWLIYALHPLNIAWATLPLLLLAGVSLGLTALVVRGHLRALAHPMATGGAAIASLIIYQAYWAAAHGLTFHPVGQLGVIELYRYAGMLLPVWVVMAAWALPPAPSRLTRGLWVVALLLPAIPEAVQILPQHVRDQDTRVAPLPRWGLLDTDVTRQAQALLTVLDHHPDCTLVTRTRKWGSQYGAPQALDAVMFRRAYVPSWQLVWWPPEPGLGLHRLTPEHFPSATCLLVLEPLDLGLAGGQVPGFTLDPPGEVLVERSFPVRPHVFADHAGGWDGDTQRFRILRVPLPAHLEGQVPSVP